MKRMMTHGCRPGATGESQALAKEAAVKLLERSIQFGHGRLSVVRLAMAINSGAVISQEHWIYCSHVAVSSNDAITQALFLEATQRASGLFELHRLAH